MMKIISETDKRHTDLKICVPEARYLIETDFDVKTRLAPSKCAGNYETLVSEAEEIGDF